MYPLQFFFFFLRFFMDSYVVPLSSSRSSLVRYSFILVSFLFSAVVSFVEFIFVFADSVFGCSYFASGAFQWDFLCLSSLQFWHFFWTFLISALMFYKVFFDSSHPGFFESLEHPQYFVLMVLVLIIDITYGSYWLGL